MEVLMVEISEDYEEAFRRDSKEYNYNVTSVSSVFDAIVAMIREHYDAVVLNTTIQKKRWKDFKSHVDQNNKRIIMCAYYDGETVTEDVLLDAHFDLLFKGTDDVEGHVKRLDVFAKRRRDLLSVSQHGATMEILIRDGMIYNHEQSTVQMGSNVVQLTDSESRIIYLLCQHRGETVTRQSLYEAIYPGGKEIGKRRNIDVHIRNLREKIGSRSIRTVRGEGYLIE